LGEAFAPSSDLITVPRYRPVMPHLPDILIRRLVGILMIAVGARNL
jgi:hypothetical protein